MTPRPLDGAPACPRPGHTAAQGYRVSRDGRYGRSPASPRQRYRCTAPDGTFHRFTPLLPRETTHGGSCPECEAHVGVHAGPAVVRTYRHRLHLVAEALAAVGRGVTYQDASQRARAAAGRDLLTGDGTGGLVAEWVDVWAPALLTALAETKPPDTLALASADVHWTNSRTGQRRRQFSVLVAYGRTAEGAGRVWGVRASPTALTPDHVRLLTDLRLPRPPRTVVAPGAAAASAVRRVWPDDEPDAASGAIPSDWRPPRLVPRGDEGASPVAAEADAVCTRLCGLLERRSFALRNARRTNLLLGLARLHLDRLDDVATYHRILREFAEANAGAAPAAQRTGHDRYDRAARRPVASLRG